MTNTTVHIINHTHWDREWFLTSTYTTEWIPGLIDRLEEMVSENPGFHFLLDGQTLIIEDLLGIRPEYEEKIRKLVSSGNLLIGPYYCQPDWQLTGGESLMRNLEYGLEIMHSMGGKTNVGWMVDTFGHLSQSPQIHQKFGLDTVYVWRGMPKLEPYFEWHGTSGHTLFGIDLFGGYRNLYGVTHAPTIAEIRLQKETERLMPYYPTPDVPLFDGYDLEDDPEDPVRWLTERGNIPAGFTIKESTPISFANEMRGKVDQLPKICGELNSGKFGATFPGTFSSRSYLKVLGHECEHLLYQVVEPLSAMSAMRGGNWPAEKFKAWSKIILQNAVHDAVCGVSIDQVHEKMEFSYRQIHAEMTAEFDNQLLTLLNGLTSGRYAVSTTPVPYEKWVRLDNELLHVQSDMLGVKPFGPGQAITAPNLETDRFGWENDHYSAKLSGDGILTVDGVRFGEIIISNEGGDTYSDETGDPVGVLRPSGRLRLTAQTDDFAELTLDGRIELNDGYVAAEVRFTFDPSPLVGVEVKLDSRGTNFHVEMKLEPGVKAAIWAGMPFDRVQRPFADTDLLPRKLDEGLSKIMMGQRELNIMNTFPMHGFVGTVSDKKSAVLFSRGIRSYRSFEDGSLNISLRRSVEWVTEGNLNNRIGDAGPFFYVPDARCEREISHKMGLYVGQIKPNEDAFNNLETSFHHSPILVDWNGSGTQTSKSFFKTDQPVSAIWPQADQLIARVWHSSGVNAGLIEEVSMGTFSEKSAESEADPFATCLILNRPLVPIGDNQGLPDQNVLGQLKKQVDALATKVADAKRRLEEASGDEKLKVEHELYVYDRERHEFLLSICLNELKLEQNGRLDADYLYKPHPQITDLGYRLNKLRIKRRIFDYVVTVV